MTDNAIVSQASATQAIFAASSNIARCLPDKHIELQVPTLRPYRATAFPFTHRLSNINVSHVTHNIHAFFAHIIRVKSGTPNQLFIKILVAPVTHFFIIFINTTLINFQVFFFHCTIFCGQPVTRERFVNSLKLNNLLSLNLSQWRKQMNINFKYM